MSLLLSKKRNKKVVVFLCTGNTCRGPMAQGYMKKAMEERGIERVEVKTAGVMTIPGLIPTPEATQVMKNAGVDIVMHRSSPLTHELIRKADIILGMTPFHVQFALRMSDEAKDKTYLLKEYAESDVKNYQITDPMGMTLEVYKRVYREMKLAIDKMLDTKDLFLDQRVQKPKVEEKPTPTPIVEKVAPEKKAAVVKKPAVPAKKGEAAAPEKDKKTAAPAKAEASTAKPAAPAAAVAADPKKKKIAPKAPPAKEKPAVKAEEKEKPKAAEPKAASPKEKAPAKPAPAKAPVKPAAPKKAVAK